MKLGYIGIDQYGNYYKLKKYPRKELMEKFNVQHISKMYVDRNRETKHIGYIISGHWVSIYEVHEWKEKG